MRFLRAICEWASKLLPTREEVRPLVDPRRADEVVDVVEIPGFTSRRLERDPRFGSFVSRQPRDPRPDSTRSRTKRSRWPRPLAGRVIIGSFFVGRESSSWRDDEIAEAHRSLLRAGRWLERQASCYGEPLSVTLPSTFFVASDRHRPDPVAIGFTAEGEGFGPLEVGAELNAIAAASRAAATLGFRDLPDLAHELGSRLDSDASVWVLHFRQAGRSLAVAEDTSGLPGINVAVCYAKEASFPEPLIGPPFTDPVTLVHELLHLFGASDKYGVPLSRFPRGDVTAHDVMLLHHESLSRLRVDPLTAREIGWDPSSRRLHSP